MNSDDKYINNQLKAFTGIFFILVILFIAPFSTAFGETKSFNPSISKYGQISIKDFGLFDIADYTLDSYDSSVVNVWAEGTYNIYTDAELFSGIEFKNIAGQLIDLYNIHYYIEVTESYIEDVPKYGKEVCITEIEINGTKSSCTKEFLGNEKITKYNNYWQEYTPKTKLKASSGKWRITAERNPNQKADFILKAHGKDFNEWAWWDGTWKKRKEVNITGGSALLNNFTVLVNVSYDSDMQTKFQDIRFVNGTCSGVQNTELSYEFEYIYNSSSALVWVKIPQLAAGINKICMYYDNALATNGENKVNAWDDYYISVWHMNNINDSKGKFNLTNNNVIFTNSLFGNGSYFNRSNSAYFNTNSTSAFNLSSNKTFEVFAKPLWTDPYTISNGIMGATSTGSWQIYIHAGSADAAKYYKAYIEPTSKYWTTMNDAILPARSYTENNYQYLTFTINRERNVAELYRNLTQNATINYTDLSWTYNTPLRIGLSAAANELFNGTMDEVRVSNTVRNSAWLNRSYANTNYSLFAFGSELVGDQSITLNYPNNLYTSNMTNITFNCTATDNIAIINMSLIINGNINYTKSGGGSNISEIIRNLNFSDGNYNWTCDTSDGTNTVTATTRNFTIRTFEWAELVSVYKAYSFETLNETFLLNITTNSTPSNVTAQLVYNGTIYNTTKTVNGNNISFISTIDIPEILSSGNITFYWNIIYGNAYYPTTLKSHYISNTVFILCNSTYNQDYLNLSFKDESNSSYIDASIVYSLFQYYIGSGTVIKNYTYINNTNNLNYLFCAYPSNYTYVVVPYVQYKQNPNYPQRIWNIGSLTYTNTLTQQLLYLLELDDGISVTLQIINSAEQLLQGVAVIVSKNIAGTQTEIAYGESDSAGLITFWLDPDFVHTFNFIKEGYPSVTQSFAPTISSYTISMGLLTNNITFIDTSKGLYYYAYPKNETLYNNTEYNFQFYINSTYWDISQFGFVLRANNTILNSISSNNNGGIVSLSQNTINYSRIYMDYYYIVNDTYQNGTRYWNVYNTEYTQYSIKNFFDDFKIYTDSGFFGLDAFGRNMIVFILIIFIVGGLSYKFGTTSPLIISGITFAVVLLFDVVLGLMPTINGNQNIPTMIIGLIFALLVIREVTQ